MAPKGNWIAQAACRGELFPDAWFSDYSGDPKYDQTLIQARRVCALRCQVRLECLAAGMSEEFGVWGGTTERKRRKMRRLPDAPKETTAALGDARRLQAMAHLGWSVTDIATDVRRYSGIGVMPRFLEEVRDGEHGEVSVELHEALVRSFNRNKTRFNSRGNTQNTTNLAKEMEWPTARMWRGKDIDDPEAVPGHDDFA
jgi:WhiB family redox-sensing transcriptional regulator